MSRWLVGSSSSSRSGSATSARASSVRRRQPPDSVSTGASAGRPRRARTVSTRCSTFQPSCSSSSVLRLGQPVERTRRVIARDLDGGVVIGRHQRADLAQAFGDHVEDRCASWTAARPARDARRARRAAATACRRRAAARRWRRAAASSCRRRCGRSGTRARRGRSASTRRRSGAGVRRRPRRLPAQAAARLRSVRGRRSCATRGGACAQDEDAPQRDAGLDPRLAQHAGQLGEQLAVGPL